MNDIPDLPIYGFAPNLGGFLSFAVAVILPFLAGLLTKQSWSGAVKGSVLLVLAFAKTLIEAWIDAVNSGVVFNLWPVFWTTAMNFAIAVIAYFGILKDTKAIAAVQRSGVKDTIDGAVVR
jgi:hypothetical protein